MAQLYEFKPASRESWLASARRTLSIQHDGLSKLIGALDGPLGEAFCRAVDMIRNTPGRTILTGMGKSGHIARKIAATLSSTGTPAFLVHPAEASHGDLGMITNQDAIVMISNSGETAELKAMLDYAKRFSVNLICITSRPDSTLADQADIALILPDAREACPIGMAPTTSTMLQLAIGDALALALLEDKGFNAAQFRTFHPGGLLGAALTHVHDVMHKAPRIPLVPGSMAMSEALLVMTQMSFGCLGVIDEDGTLIGVVTDGDLRRHMSRDLVDLPVAEVMTRAPRTIEGDALASEALEQLNTLKITSLFVCDEARRPVGLIHIHDLLRLGVR
ncbi:MAG: SIS domain-containing protein [Parvibaculaceae bacterium]|jgi:arabinose-5-phosphate isomerase